MEVDQRRSRLRSLPPEIRNQIWLEVFKDKVRYLDRAARALDRNASNTGNIGLMLSCREIYRETIDMFYKSTSFRFADPAVGLKFLTHIPRRHLQSIPDVRCDLAKFHEYRKPTPAFAETKRNVCELIKHFEARGVRLRPGVFKSSFKVKLAKKRWTIHWSDDPLSFCEQMKGQETIRMIRSGAQPGSAIRKIVYGSQW